MPNIQKMLNEEIRRLAKKEVKAAMDSLRTQVGNLKKQIQEQKDLIKQLQKGPAPVSAPSPIEPVPVDEDLKSLRMNGARIKKIRMKCGVTQDQMAQLLGVSRWTIIKWEVGKFGPREEAKAKLVALQKMGKHDLKAKLDEVIGPNTAANASK